MAASHALRNSMGEEGRHNNFLLYLNENGQNFERPYYIQSNSSSLYDSEVPRHTIAHCTQIRRDRPANEKKKCVICFRGAAPSWKFTTSTEGVRDRAALPFRGRTSKLLRKMFRFAEGKYYTKGLFSKYRTRILAIHSYLSECSPAKVDGGRGRA